MKQAVIVICSLLLAVSLAGCGGTSGQPDDTLTADAPAEQERAAEPEPSKQEQPAAEDGGEGSGQGTGEASQSSSQEQPAAEDGGERSGQPAEPVPTGQGTGEASQPGSEGQPAPGGESEGSGQPAEPAPTEQENGKQPHGDRLIQITTEEGEQLVFQLNDSPAAASLCSQLPFSIDVTDFAGSEKIFYLPEELETDGTPMAKGPAGTLAYYEPWGNVAIFYGECGGSSGLYGLGRIVSGLEKVPGLSGEIRVEGYAE